MATSASILSEALQSITKTKIAELKKQQQAHETSKQGVLQKVESAESDKGARLNALLEGFDENPRSSHERDDIQNVKAWLAQSRYDPTVTPTVLQKFETKYKGKLDIETRRFRFAQLYSSLLTEWLTHDDRATYAVDPGVAEPEATSLDDSFEVLEKDRLQQLRFKFEAVVFTPFETDEVEIDHYLANLFRGEEGSSALKSLRSQMQSFGEGKLKESSPFGTNNVKLVIRSLLGNELLKPEKKNVLQDFLKDDDVLAEITDVLNMRWMELKNWSWDAGAEGLPVEPRRQLNGKYRIVMDEELLQAILVHYVGLIWSVELRSALTESLRQCWTDTSKTSKEDVERWNYFILNHTAFKTTKSSFESNRQQKYVEDFYLAQLPKSMADTIAGYDDDDAQHDGSDSNETSRKSFVEIRQDLLREMASEVLLHKELHGEVAVVQSDVKWFATGLPHSTLFAILRFCAVPETWIDFFRKFIETPLNLNPSAGLDSEPGEARIRRRGVPMAHSLETFFGELVLTFLDLAVNLEADGLLLYRLHDDFLLWGQPDKCSQAWTTMKEFAAVMGLELNEQKTGSVYYTKSSVQRNSEIESALPNGPVRVGFLELSKETGEWTIDEKSVEAHTKQLLKQLKASPTVFSWIQTWNSCIGRFFLHTFGQPARCFGPAHVEAILKTHQRIQGTLFAEDGLYGSNVNEHLKHLISKNHGIEVSDIPDAFLAIPEELGGLGLRNPFVPFLLRRSIHDKDPVEEVTQFLAHDRKDYEACRKAFFDLKEGYRRKRLHQHFPEEEEADAKSASALDHLPDPSEFMSYEEWSKHWKTRNKRLADLKDSLKAKVEAYHPIHSQSVQTTIEHLSRFDRQHGRTDGVSSHPDPEDFWTIVYHSDELFELFGGLRIVDKRLLPLGIMKMLRSKKVSWQMVL